MWFITSVVLLFYKFDLSYINQQIYIIFVVLFFFLLFLNMRNFICFSITINKNYIS